MNLRLAEQLLEQEDMTEIKIPEGDFVLELAAPQGDSYRLSKKDADGVKEVASIHSPFASLLVEILKGRRYPLVPFVDGPHSAAWEVHNCDSCVDGPWASGKLVYPFYCAIKMSLHYSDCTTKDVSQDMAGRMGYFANEEAAKRGEVWRCSQYAENPDQSKWVKRRANGCPDVL